MKWTVLILLILACKPFPLPAQEKPKDKGLRTISGSAVQGPLEFLASDWMSGRETGTKGEFMASDYIASIYKSMGLKPGGSSGRYNPSYFQNISFRQTAPGENQACAIIFKGSGGRYQMNLAYKTDYSVTPGSQSVEAEAEVVFIGYGIEDAKLRHNDFKGIDVKGKILIRLAGYPGWMDPDSKSFKRFNSTGSPAMNQLEASKDAVASSKGAFAVIEIRGGTSEFTPVPGNLPFRYTTDTYEGDVPFDTEVRYRTSLPGSDATALTKVNLSDRALHTLIDGSGINFENYELQAAGARIKPAGILDGRYLSLVSTVDSRIIRGRNVIGVLEGKDTKRCLVVGAHYDHIGQIKGFIYNGSDDNASGTAGVIAIARAMLATGEKPDVSIVFCAWTAEEKGLLGSAYYVSHPFISNILCYLNYDMISRTAPDDTTGMKCDFTYSSGSPYLKDLTEKHIRDYSIKLNMDYKTSPRPVGGSDFSSFSGKGIPIFLIHGKFTKDYHQFTDHSDQAVIPYMTEIVKLGYLDVYELAHRNW